MAINATTTITHDGRRHADVVLSGISDGILPPDETNQVKVDVAAFAVYNCKLVAIESIDWQVTGGIVRLLWEDNANGPVTIMELTGEGDMDFRATSGISNNASQPTGNISVTTLGFDAGSNYLIRMRLRKQKVVN